MKKYCFKDYCEEIDEDDIYPEYKTSQKAKARFSPYKVGGKYRTLKGG